MHLMMLLYTDGCIVLPLWYFSLCEHSAAISPLQLSLIVVSCHE